jgi:carotenoid cleavage dioxygenase
MVMDGDVRINPYLAGNFAPIRSEDDFQLEVVGEIPTGLRGALFRTGPNPQFEPRDPNHHWFVGDGMIHGFYLEGGKASYRNRYVRTPKWELEHAAGRSLFAGFNPMLSDPSVAGKDGGVANTNIVWHAGRLLALEEGHAPFEMGPRDLGSKGYVDAYRGRTTAHPKIDPATGEMVWFGYGVGEAPLSAGMSYGVTDAGGKVVRRDDFQAPYSSMVHDFMVTETHVLFPILPLTGSLERAMQGLPAFAWEPGKGSFVGVMRRDADVSTIRWFNTEACYVFHPLNAWEEGDKLFADVMRYDSAPLFPNADGSPGARSAARLVRWTFDLAGASDAIKEEPLDDLDGEFPRVDPRVDQAERHRPPGFPGRAPRALRAGRRRPDLRAGLRAAARRNRGGRRLAHRGGLARRRGPFGPAGLRGDRHRQGPDRHRQGPAPRALRLPRQLGLVLG